MNTKFPFIKKLRFCLLIFSISSVLGQKNLDSRTLFLVSDTLSSLNRELF